ncbi:PH and SEC7 domain-containing protein 3, partial [Camelus dromedarius]
GEDEVFLRDNKEHLEKKPGLERDKQRALEQEEPLRGGEDDVLGPGCAEDPTDVYSSQFEAVLDNTSLYYSAGSSETLYSEPDSYFSFEMPLTPMIQQRIKEGGQFLERTPAGGQQDILSVSADGGVVMGCSGGITNGLSGSRSSVYSRGTPEAAFWGRYPSHFHSSRAEAEVRVGRLKTVYSSGAWVWTTGKEGQQTQSYGRSFASGSLKCVTAFYSYLVATARRVSWMAPQTRGARHRVYHTCVQLSGLGALLSVRGPLHWHLWLPPIFQVEC